MCKYATNIYFLLKKTPFHLIFIFLFLKESISFVSCFIIRSFFFLFIYLFCKDFLVYLLCFDMLIFVLQSCGIFFFSFLQQMFSEYSLGKQLILCLFFSSIRVTDSCPFQQDYQIPGHSSIFVCVSFLILFFRTKVWCFLTVMLLVFLPQFQWASNLEN